MNIIVSWKPTFNQDGSIVGKNDICFVYATKNATQTKSFILPKIIYGGDIDLCTGKGHETWGYIGSYSGEHIIDEWIDASGFHTKNEAPTEGACLAYKLPNPIPFSIDRTHGIIINPDNDVVVSGCDSVTIIDGVNSIDSRISTLEKNVVALAV